MQPLIEVGTPVEAKFRGNKQWYKGRISRVHGTVHDAETYYDIAYDDGDVDVHVPRHHVRVEEEQVSHQLHTHTLCLILSLSHTHTLSLILRLSSLPHNTYLFNMPMLSHVSNKETPRDDALTLESCMGTGHEILSLLQASGMAQTGSHHCRVPPVSEG